MSPSNHLTLQLQPVLPDTNCRIVEYNQAPLPSSFIPESSRHRQFRRLKTSGPWQSPPCRIATLHREVRLRQVIGQHILTNQMAGPLSRQILGPRGPRPRRILDWEPFATEISLHHQESPSGQGLRPYTHFRNSQDLFVSRMTLVHDGPLDHRS